VRTFAGLQIVGDHLDPHEVTRVLGIRPKQAYAKGEQYLPSPHARPVVGQTGVWYFNTDGFTDGSLEAHVWRLLATDLLKNLHYPNLNRRMWQIRELIRRQHARAVVSCFWHGSASDEPPSIPDEAAAAFELMDMEIETDFSRDEPAEVESAAA
jgi:hypothetical protein